MIPPSIRTLRQPHCGIIQAARKPPKAAPSGKPQNMALVSVARRPSGQYSLIRVTALGMAALSGPFEGWGRSDRWTSLPCLRIAHSKCPASLSQGRMVRV